VCVCMQPRRAVCVCSLGGLLMRAAFICSTVRGCLFLCLRRCMPEALSETGPSRLIRAAFLQGPNSAFSYACAG
jgi:hypothetical protein